MSDDDFKLNWRGKSIDELLNTPRGMPVQDSDELTRILNLPRRPVVVPGSPTADALIELEMQKYSLGPRACACQEIVPGTKCLTKLLWIQAWMLYEMRVVGGLVACASTGIGKCVDGSVEVFDYKNGRRRSVTEDGSLAVASLDVELSVRPATAFASGIKQCVEVKLADGTNIITSIDHPILTAGGWAHAERLRPGDFVAVAAQLPEPTNITSASDAEIAFIAYMLSDGSCNNGSLGFTNATPQVIDDWIKVASELGYEVIEKPSRTHAREFTLRTNKRSLNGNWALGYTSCVDCGESNRMHAARGLCRRCYQRPKSELVEYPTSFDTRYDSVRSRWGLYGLAKNKRVHPDVWGLSKSQVALFLNRFWACDGYVGTSTLEITLASEKLIDDLRFLLLRLGIRSRKHYKQSGYREGEIRKTFDAWRLMIGGLAALQFLTEVGDVLGKEGACRQLRDKLNSKKRNTNYDVVPIGPKEFIEICDELGLPSRKSHRSKDIGRVEMHKILHATHRQCISRSRFMEFCSVYGYQGVYSKFNNKDIAWEKVTSVVDVGVRPVYDLSVPGTQNFVANGVIIHNTLTTILGPLALNIPLTLLLIPPNVLDQIQTDYLLIAEHFRVPNLTIHLPGRKTWKGPVKWAPNGTLEPSLHVLPYSQLSSKNASSWIENLGPSAIISDEADALKSTESSRMMRILRYGENHQNTKFVFMSGSIFGESISEAAPMSALALKWGSPLPVDARVYDEWGRCLDPVPNPCPPGALIRFLEPGEGTNKIRQSIRRRMAETLGFIMVEGRQAVFKDGGEEVAISIRERTPPVVPAEIEEALAKVRDWVRPVLSEGEAEDIITDPLERAKCAREIAMGFYYKWIYPRGEPIDLRMEWFFARKQWNQELRYKTLRGDLHLDSPKLCEEAARRYWGDLPKDPALPEWKSEHWPRWRDVMDLVKPKTIAVRLHPYLVEDAIQWSQQNNGIIWYSMVEFAQWARELSGMPLFGEGSGPEIIKERGDRPILASIKSHGRGRNRLQFAFNTQLFANTFSSARMWQQSLARLYRRGQESSEVSTEVYLHTPELQDTFEQALRKGEFVEAITNERPHLLEAWESGGG